jgi:DNA ligase (NAD+)
VQEEGPRIKCPNRFGCSAQLQGRIIHLASRSALDIEGLGEETAALLVTQGLVSSLAELFDISPEQLVEYEGFAEKSAASLVEAIQSKKAPDLPQFLIALGIPEVGTAVARDLSGYFGSIAAILGATAEELEQIDGIGPKMSEVITAFLEDERNRSAIDAILARGVEPVASAPVDRGFPSAGTAVFTGALPIPRASAEAAWRAVGGRTAISVSAKTDFVVVGENAGSKREKAERLEVVILNFGEFVAKVVSMGGEVDVP